MLMILSMTYHIRTGRLQINVPQDIRDDHTILARTIAIFLTGRFTKQASRSHGMVTYRLQKLFERCVNCSRLIRQFSRARIILGLQRLNFGTT